jgi:uncharacterized protein (DUF608 family)
MKGLHAMKKATPYSANKLDGDGRQRVFRNEDLLQIAMPLGGIGAGCISLNGYGALMDFSIRNRPATSAMPDRNVIMDAAFALLHIKGKEPVTRLIEGPVPREKIYNQGLKCHGFRESGYEGLPRFEKCSFHGEYPFGEVDLSDRKVPLRAKITGFSPFIPLDDRNSSLPVAIVEYTLTNRSKKKVDFDFSYHMAHPAPGTGPEDKSRNDVIPGAGVFFHSVEDPKSEQFGSGAFLVVGHKANVKGMWFRGGWFDAVSVLWREVATGTFKTNKGSDGIDTGGRNGGSILIEGSLKPGESVTYPVVIAWYFPNCHYEVGRATTENQECCPGGKCDPENPPPKWRPYYVSQWKDAKNVALYVRKNYDSLRDRTKAFHDAFFSSTLPSYVVDAVSANLGIMKSPTVLRQENGHLWTWEGCTCDWGCCHGSCTHVWNYAQAFPHLFPQLERTLREQEYLHSMDERGHVNFRSALPEGPTDHGFHAASDGQLGGIMKLYREWQICGDREWLARLYPLAKRSLDYCIQTWDPNHQGVLIEPHHNTYDIEFWGADGMCSSIYIGALAAMAELTREMENPGDAEFYENLAKKGAAYLDDHLFNGEYYHQKVQYRGLRDTSFLEQIKKVDRKSGTVAKLLKKEGPKYQYGTGCISDGVIGAWMAEAYGIDSPMTKENVRKTLKSIFQYNWKESLWEHANPQRPGFALGDEPGLLLCSWPNGGKPTLPFVYSDEVWTGIEYQVAAHLISQGMVKEGLTIVRGVRERYDGRTRNPWNEYECGSYYARAMSSYSLLWALSGFRYSAAKKTLWLGPKMHEDRFKTFFSTATGFGTISLTKTKLTIEMVEGKLDADRLVLTRDGKTQQIETKIRARSGEKCTVALKQG